MPITYKDFRKISDKLDAIKFTSMDELKSWLKENLPKDWTVTEYKYFSEDIITVTVKDKSNSHIELMVWFNYIDSLERK